MEHVKAAFWTGFCKEAGTPFEELFSDQESRERAKKKAPIDQPADYAFLPEMFAGESAIQGRANYV